MNVHSTKLDFRAASKKLRELNGNRAAIEPVAQLQYDFQTFICMSLKSAAQNDERLLCPNNIHGGTAVIAQIDLDQLEVIFALESMVLHDGLSDVVIVRSTSDDRHIVLSGDSLKKNLKDGVVGYDVPSDDVTHDVTELMKPYSNLSARLWEAHKTPKGSINYHAVKAVLEQMYTPVENPHALYQEYFSYLVFPQPALFLGQAVREPGAP